MIDLASLRRVGSEQRSGGVDDAPPQPPQRRKRPRHPRRPRRPRAIPAFPRHLPPDPLQPRVRGAPGRGRVLGGHQSRVFGEDAPKRKVAASPVARPRDVSESLGARLVPPHGVRDALDVRADGALVPQREPRAVRARVAHRALIHQIFGLHAQTARTAHDRELEGVGAFAFAFVRVAVGRGRRVLLARQLAVVRGRARRGTHVRAALRAPPHASRASRADEPNAGTAQRDAGGVPVAARHRGLRGGGDRLEAHCARRLGRIAGRGHRHRARARERSDAPSRRGSGR
mmetsp:Transcript_7570/g.31480  ORF Transcript_7570/g.31480 Transcript_7570/m.31480 type:complete len:287 (-) Transcript_7570:3035-3895(-)